MKSKTVHGVDACLDAAQGCTDSADDTGLRGLGLYDDRSILERFKLSSDFHKRPKVGGRADFTLQGGDGPQLDIRQ